MRGVTARAAAVMSNPRPAEITCDIRHVRSEPSMLVHPLRLAASSFLVTSLTIIALHLLLK